LVKSPKVYIRDSGILHALQDLGIKEAWIMAPVRESFSIEKNVFVAGFRNFLARMDSSIER
jgi:hypothetical protein